MYIAKVRGGERGYVGVISVLNSFLYLRAVFDLMLCLFNKGKVTPDRSSDYVHSRCTLPVPLQISHLHMTAADSDGRQTCNRVVIKLSLNRIRVIFLYTVVCNHVGIFMLPNFEKLHSDI